MGKVHKNKGTPRKGDNMAGKTEYKNNWQKENVDRVNLTMPKGRKEIIKAHAEARSESVNGFINRAIEETIARDKITAECIEKPVAETYFGRKAKALRMDFQFKDLGMDRYKEKDLGNITHILSLVEVKELEKQYKVSPFSTEIIYEVEQPNEFCEGGIEKVKVLVEYFSECRTPLIVINGVIQEYGNGLVSGGPEGIV